MGSAYIPNQNFTYHAVDPGTPGATSRPAPGSVLLLEVDGVVYPNGYRIEYNGGFRNLFPLVGTTGQVDIMCHTVAYGEDIPAYALPSNFRVLIISSYSSKLPAPANVEATSTVNYTDQNLGFNILCDILPDAFSYNIYLKTYGPGTDPITLTNPVIWLPLELGKIPEISYPPIFGDPLRHLFRFSEAFDWFNPPTTPQTIKIAGVDYEGLEGIPAFATFTVYPP